MLESNIIFGVYNSVTNLRAELKPQSIKLGPFRVRRVNLPTQIVKCRLYASQVCHYSWKGVTALGYDGFRDCGSIY